MKLTTKKVQVETYKVKAAYTPNIISDLTNGNKYYEYKHENEYEKLIIEKYFKLEYIENDCVYYTMTIKMLRKAKLLILNKDEIADIIKKIISNSKIIYSYFGIDSVQQLENTLVEELSKSINKDIINKMCKL